MAEAIGISGSNKHRSSEENQIIAQKGKHRPRANPITHWAITIRANFTTKYDKSKVKKNISNSHLMFDEIVDWRFLITTMT